MIPALDLSGRRVIPVIDLTEVTVKYDATARVFVAFCPALDFCTQGRTESEARSACTAGVKMVIGLCREHGFPLPIPGGWRPSKVTA